MPALGGEVEAGWLSSRQILKEGATAGPTELCRPSGKAFLGQKAERKALLCTSCWSPSSQQSYLIWRTKAQAVRLLSHLCPGEKGATPPRFPEFPGEDLSPEKRHFLGFYWITAAHYRGGFPVA